MNQFEIENKEIFNSFLNRRFLKPGKETPINIEWFLTADCDQNCSYCYLQKQKEDLYPKELRNLKDIVSNAKILLDWFEEKELKVNLHIFTGEFFNLGKTTFEILDMLYNHCTNKNNKSQIKNITIPSNMSFILDKAKADKIGLYMEKFNEAGVMIGISASIDGKYLEKQTRPMRKADKRDDTFYDDVFKFIAKHGGGLHPMVASYGIEHWIENYKWFKDMTNKYLKGSQPMMLEVRDNDWTDESIEHYLKYLDYVIEDEFNNRHSGDKKAFAKRVFLKPLSGYDNISLTYKEGREDKISCMMQDCLYIRMGDLSIVPCHRLSYEHLNYGKLLVNKGEVTDSEPGNISLMSAIYSMKGTNMPICDTCTISKFCVKGCLGSQYEVSKETMIPNNAVCNLYNKKIDFLLNKYNKMGILQELKNININPDIIKTINEIAKKKGYDK
jgi:radical SAM protein with 4Fe4S-binding SPASM domain